MKRANLALHMLFCAGLALVVCGFFLIIPDDWRSCTGYMNLIITLLLYCGTWLSFTMLCPRTDAFAERIPVMTVFWGVFYKFAIVAVLAMIAMGYFHLSFAWQIYTHLVIFFIFSVVLGAAYWTSSFIKNSHENDKQVIGKIDSVKSRFAILSVQVASLGAEYSDIKIKFSSIAEDCKYLSGSKLDEARRLEDMIEDRLTTFSSMLSSAAAPAEMERVLSELSGFIAMRKVLPME